MNHAIAHPDAGVTNQWNEPGDQGQRSPDDREREASASWVDLSVGIGGSAGGGVFFVVELLLFHLF